MEDVYVRVKNKIKAKVHLGSLGEGLSPFPFVLTFPQDDHERFLLEKLKNLGIEVEWKTELLSLAEHGEGVKTLLKAQQEETAYFKYICGCDGAHSTVRKQMKIEFKGEKYKQHFYVMDVGDVRNLQEKLNQYTKKRAPDKGALFFGIENCLAQASYRLENFSPLRNDCVKHECVIALRVSFIERTGPSAFVRR